MRGLLGISHQGFEPAGKDHLDAKDVHGKRIEAGEV